MSDIGILVLTQEDSRFFDMSLKKKSLEDPERNVFILSKGHDGVLLYCIFCDLGLHDWDELLNHYNTMGHTFGAHPNRNSWTTTTARPPLWQART